MKLGVLFESDEWSDHKLAAELEKALAAFSAHWEVELINLEEPGTIERALTCNVLVSRIFASAQFRGHNAALARMAALIPRAEAAGIQLINPGRAHFFEIDKHSSTEALREARIAVPKIYACGTAGELQERIEGAGKAEDAAPFAFPAIVKPNCGGRTTFTAIVRETEELMRFLEPLPPTMDFLLEEYIQPERGFITRIEIVGGTPKLVVKRSIAPNGLSAYHLGSEYELYEDVSAAVLAAAEAAAGVLDFQFGSFDVIETDRGAFFIDANSISNVSEDCTETFRYDMMRDYAQTIARMITSALSCGGIQDQAWANTG